jgi:predicted nucleic acid-binding protein
MKPVFADTAFYVAVHNRRDQLHAQAVALAESLIAPVVTSEFVLVEVANFFKRPGDRAMFASIDGALRADPLTTIVPADSRLSGTAQGMTAER